MRLLMPRRGLSHPMLSRRDWRAGSEAWPRGEPGKEVVLGPLDALGLCGASCAASKEPPPEGRMASGGVKIDALLPLTSSTRYVLYWPGPGRAALLLSLLL